MFWVQKFTLWEVILIPLDAFTNFTHSIVKEIKYPNSAIAAFFKKGLVLHSLNIATMAYSKNQGSVQYYNKRAPLKLHLPKNLIKFCYFKDKKPHFYWALHKPNVRPGNILKTYQRECERLSEASLSYLKFDKIT